LKSNKKYLALAILFGLITVLLISIYLNRLGGRAVDELALEKVVAARATIPAYTVVTAEMLELVSLPAMAVHPGAVRDPEEIVGGVTRAALIGGEQILAERVAVDLERAHFACRVPEGMRAASIPVNAVSGVAGYISPGDRVDVLVSYNSGAGTVTFTAMQDIMVLAAGSSYREREGGDPEVVDTLTLAVTPAQSQEIAYYTLECSFHIILRSPADRETRSLGTFGSQGGFLPRASTNSLPKSLGDSDHGDN
jgi:pilus assembly protein CpaB